MTVLRFLRPPALSAGWVAAGFGSGAACAWAVDSSAAFTGLISLPLWTCLGFLVLAIPGFLRPGGAWVGRYGLPLVITIGLALFGFLLAAKWQAMASSDVILGGLLPRSDAANYLDGALHFLQFGELTAWTSRRPLSALHLAGLLEIGGSLHFALLALGIGSASAIATVIAVLGRTNGTGMAAGASAILVPFYFPSIGSFMSENIGLMLGSCGFALMWLALYDDRRSTLFALGAGCMALGLNTRAGAMFVLPVLILYAGWKFRRTQRFSMSAASWTLVAIAAAFAINSGLLFLYGATKGGGFSNFSFTLYGLVSGRHEWTRIYQTMPDIRSLPEGEQAKEVYRLAMVHLADHPGDLLRGIIRRYNDFIFNARWYRLEGIGALRYGLMAIALVGLVHISRRMKSTPESFVLAGTIGTLLSAPFLGDGGMRVHAATVPFSAALIGFGIHAISGWLKRPAFKGNTGKELQSLPVVIILIAICLPLAIIPTLAPRTPAPATAHTCTGGGAFMALATIPDAGIDLISPKDLNLLGKGVLAHGTLPPDITNVTPPVRIGSALRLSGADLGFSWIASKSDSLLPARFTACTRKTGDILLLDDVRALP